MRPQGIDQPGALADRLIARPTLSHVALLFGGRGPHETHGWATSTTSEVVLSANSIPGRWRHEIEMNFRRKQTTDTCVETSEDRFHRRGGQDILHARSALPAERKNPILIRCDSVICGISDVDLVKKPA